jgi:arabinoxylan arabinofuranohydrolase
MKNTLKLMLLLWIWMPLVGHSQNPIIQTIYTADPAPLVYKDTLFLYTGHDEDKSTWFTMKDWHTYSTIDMVNWTDRGVALSVKTFNWASKDAWAGQCIFRNGKFYFYVPVNQANGKGMAIGVAVSDHPTGPFTDALKKPLLHTGAGDIDPTVFIDDDGQAYLFWGNPYLKYVKLNKDMTSYAGDVVTVPLNEKGFSVRYKDQDKRPSAYEEAPWIYKRKDLYYLLYAAGGVPEHLAYSTSKSILGPWLYGDTIMPIIKSGGAFTNHPGLIDYKGKSYLFYHNGALPGGGGFNRSVSVDEFKFNADGTIPRIANTITGVKPVGNLNPFKRTEAETMAWEEGIETAASETGVYVTAISNNDHIKVRNVAFGKGANQFSAHVATEGTGGTIELRLDGLNGELLASCQIKSTGGSKQWATQTFKINQKIKGIHELYFVFKGNGDQLFDFDWWQFK